ncbi:hypothetical protein HF883_07285 [Cloacibacillus porcorum]|uniref:hypothetical protein n=1 Tax=Cloacibacillus porcorum TaxID=1197717 RepID=UPI0014591D09|nr:hypothetical protein [Cloacibacillus porcorum]MCC8185255.1 hypothetical protein [Cloacibacillus porcorum]NMF18027.1 hypothetical protein [Cloacibacillus porcorum]
MKNKKLAAFTLVEALIGVIIMMIVIGGIALSIKMGIDMYGRAEAHSELINGMRFTLDSFNREISPMLDVTREVEILSTDISNIPSVSDDNHYIYLENGSLTHRSKSGDEVLTGSEYIDRVVFSYPTDTKETGENYTLRMDLTARHERYGDAEYNTTLEKAMYNLPSKRGDNGNILRFKYSDAVDVNVINIKHYKRENNGDLIDISNSADIKGITIIVSYDLTIDGTVNEPYEDVSLVEYFMSSSPEANLDISDETPNRENQAHHYWQLVDEHGTPLDGTEIATSGDLHLHHSGETTTWRFGTIRSRITPRIADINGTLIAEGAPVWGPYTEIIDNNNLLHTSWSQAIFDAVHFNSMTDGFISRKGDVVFDVDTTTGMKIIKFNAQGNGNSAVLAEVDLKYMKRERTLEREKLGAAFTNITNYSLVVDAKVTNTSGYGILINGRVINLPTSLDQSAAENGYLFQFDRARKSFPIRLFSEKGGQMQGIKGFTGINSCYYFGAETEADLVEFAGLDGGYNWKSEYVPAMLKNSSFNLPENNSLKFFDSRQRVLYTILEYYCQYVENPDKPGEYIKDSDAMKKPHYLVRMRALKTGDEVDEILKTMSPERKAQDPWHIGEEFYGSEPIWYGDFVGAAPMTSGDKYIKSGDKYIYEVKNFSDIEKYGGPKIALSIPSGDVIPKRNRNIFKFEGKTKTAGYAVVKGYDLDIRESFKKYAKYDSGKYGYFNNTDVLNNIFQEKGKRYIGIRVWKSATVSDDVVINEINMAPGFSGDELKAILPKGARIYETGETYSKGDWNKLAEKDKDITFSWDDTTDADLNKKVFSNASSELNGFVSDGEGNGSGNIGIMDIRHIWTSPPNECKCPLCKLFK